MIALWWYNIQKCPRQHISILNLIKVLCFCLFLVHLFRLTLPQTVRNVFIERLADYILVKSTFGFSLAWDGSSGVYLKMTEAHKGRPCGLCGNYNDDGSDDLSSSRGETITLIISVSSKFRTIISKLSRVGYSVWTLPSHCCLFRDELL